MTEKLAVYTTTLAMTAVTPPKTKRGRALWTRWWLAAYAESLVAIFLLG